MPSKKVLPSEEGAALAIPSSTVAASFPPVLRPMDAQQEFEEANEVRMKQARARSVELEAKAKSNGASPELTKLREAAFGRPLTPAETEMLDDLGLG